MVSARDDLARVLGQRRHHVDHVDDLETALLGRLDRLLAGDHQHRHGAELGVGGGGDEVRRARAERRQADARLAR